jgi:GntR family transcriptional regulator, transcriptional repressor for pyruvate dehydrogenase complex
VQTPERHALSVHHRQAARANHKPKKTALLVSYRIVEQIARRELKPGAPLTPERDMLAEFGVARGTLREALRFLEMQGVITIKTGPGGGPVVAMPDSRQLASMIGLLLQFRGATYRTVLDARLVLEPVLAGKASENATAEQLEALADSLTAMSEHLDDNSFFLDENENFHELIAAASGNELFSLLIASLAWITDGTALGVQYHRKSRESVLETHTRIYEAIRARKPTRATAAMRAHVVEFATFLEKKYPFVLDTALTWEQISG